MELVRMVTGLKLGDRWGSAKALSRSLGLVEVVVADGEVLGVDVKGLMPRPCKARRVRGKPGSSYFKPAGKRMSELDEVVVSRDEFEAIRLVDFVGLSQGEAGDRMKISQSTLSRILVGGRRKVAEGIVKGKGIRLEKTK